MAESTLSVTWTELQAELGYRFGYGRAATGATRLANLLAATRGGNRQFLSPPILPGEEVAHSWSFLKVSTTLTAWADVAATVMTGDTTVTAASATFYPSMIGHTLTAVASGNTYTITGYTSALIVTVSSTMVADTGLTFTMTATGDYRLPDDFGGFNEPLHYNASSYNNHPIRQTGTGNIYGLRQQPLAAVVAIRPELYAVLPLASAGLTAQRSDLMLWPTPQSDHVLRIRYKVQQEPIDDTNEYPLGGMAYGDTLLASCLAYLETMVRGGQGPLWQNFMTQLAASVSRDRADNAPDIIGYNGNGPRGTVRRLRTSSLTINGVAVS
jgi:hypothetical protein